ncbi:MAG: helix-turn-helix transcriptional regulator [Clostridia bacterium]|nr:helix-turn-helix transcriptional regulator [Clostridia bacterium]
MKNLRKVRKEHGMTMKDLAVKIGVSESAISQYENDKRQPGYETLIELCRIFNVSADYLLGIEESEEFSITEEDLELLKIYKTAKQSDKQHINALAKAIDKFLKVDE